jgi:hypothetical protein
MPDGTIGRRDTEFLRAAAEGWRNELGPTDFLAHRSPVGRFAALFPNAAAGGVETAALRLQALAPDGSHCTIGVATWNGIELPAALVERAETQIELEKAAAQAD